MPRTVILRHGLPDGTVHFDWLIERSDPDAGLIAFRTDERPDLAAATLDAERISDHRREYLTYEGEVSGGRGTVRRVAEGVCAVTEDSSDQFAVFAAFGGVMRRYVGAPSSPSCWRFAISRAQAGDC